MPPNIIPEYRKKYMMGKTEAIKTLKEIKEEVVSQILEMPPILARGHYDAFIDVDIKTDPISVKWNKENIEKWDIGDLMMVRNYLNNRYEQQRSIY